jgi:predicted PhzF superfamily epimerase YddE/YHI9
VLFRFHIPDAQKVVFSTMSGDLTVARKGDLLEMEFPAFKLNKVEVTKEMAEALGAEPKEAYLDRDLLCVFDDESIVRSLSPDMEKVRKLDGLLLSVTAPGKEADCVSRSFAPKLNVVEDPACGSAHCQIAPLWTQKLGKSEIAAYQASRRGGTLHCRVQGDKVFMAGKAALFSRSELFV